MASDSSFLPAETELFLRHLKRDKVFLKPQATRLGELATRLPLPIWAQQTILGDMEPCRLTYCSCGEILDFA